MQNILSLLPTLACPVGMGLMMWLIMRMGKEQRPSDAAAPQEEGRRAIAPGAAPQPSSSPSLFKAIWDCLQMCLNWKVLIGLAVVAVLVGVVAPQFFWGVIPLLLVFACPLSMVVMMLSMSRSKRAVGSGAASCVACEPAPADASEGLEQPRSSGVSVKW